MIRRAITVLSAFVIMCRNKGEIVSFDKYSNLTLLKEKAEARSGKRKKYMHGKENSKQLNSRTFHSAFGMFFELRVT